MSDNLPAPRTEITPLAEQFPIINPATRDEVREVFEANLGAHGMSARRMDVIKVPTGGGQSWTIQSIDGEIMIKEMRGIVLAWSPGQTYYRTAYSERGKARTPPDCVSRDGTFGKGDPGGACRRCPLNEWGSDPKGGRGKACKEIIRLIFLRADQILPELITIPPTSIKNVQQYFWRLSSSLIPYWTLVTTLRLEKTSNMDGIDYARVIIGAGPRFNPAEKAALAPYQEQVEQLLRNMEVEADFTRDDDSD